MCFSFRRVLGVTCACIYDRQYISFSLELFYGKLMICHFFPSELYYFHYDIVHPASSHLGYLACFHTWFCFRMAMYCPVRAVCQFQAESFIVPKTVCLETQFQLLLALRSVWKARCGNSGLEFCLQAVVYCYIKKFFMFFLFFNNLSLSGWKYLFRLISILYRVYIPLILNCLF